MRRIVRFLVIGVLILALLVVVGAGLATVFIKPEAYKPHLIAAVKKATGHTLTLEGELSLSLFPGI
ncbi:MAG: AsmA family protein, partial [Desulfovibrio sp.]|nr:AsmA family protein [Desulfovibrio sp.]